MPEAERRAPSHFGTKASSTVFEPCLCTLSHLEILGVIVAWPAQSPRGPRLQGCGMLWKAIQDWFLTALKDTQTARAKTICNGTPMGSLAPYRSLPRPSGNQILTRRLTCDAGRE